MNFQVKLKPESVVARSPLPVRRKPRQGLFWWLRTHVGFLLVVVIPTVLATAYYGYFAAPVYISTTQYVVKTASQTASTPGIGTFFQSIGLAPSSSDAYAVAAYITSRDALAVLEKNTDIREIYNRPEADFIARFPNRLFPGDFEHLFWHYLNWVDVSFDTTTNVTTATVYAFRSADAQMVAQQILALGEAAVNRMNERSSADVMSAASKEVDKLEGQLKTVEASITEFRNHEQLLDPTQTSLAATTMQATIETSLVAARALLAQVQQMTPGSLQIPGMRAQIQNLEKQAALEDAKNAGGPNTLAPKISVYQALQAQLTFIQQLLQTAVGYLDSTAIAVAQQRLYLERIAEPHLADIPQYPYRILDSFLVFVSALLVYAIGRTLTTAVKEHVLASAFDESSR